MLKVFIFFAVLVLFGLRTYCQNNTLEFVENKGQWDSHVKYKGDFTTGAFFLTQNGFKVLQSNPKDLQQLADVYHGKVAQAQDHSTRSNNEEPSVTIHSHAYEVQFENTAQPVIQPDKPLSSYNNYFTGNDPGKWKGNCRIFQAVTYRNMYRNVDVRYYTNNGQLKYDIIVYPGADIGSIALKYDGADALQLKNKELLVKTSLGDNREMEPYSYQVINGLKKVVDCRFIIAGNVVKFDVPDYNPAATLIIDPTLIFSTFTGSTEDNWGYTATYGTDGSFYAGGIVFGQGFPVSNGSFQTTWHNGANEGGIGGYDIGIIKFNPSGSNRIYATYIGGNGNEQPHSLVVDAQGDLVMAGRTNSTDYPLTGAKVGPCGNYDIVLTKLNATGTALIGSLRIGGTANDGANIGPKYVNPNGEISIRRNYGDDARSEVLLDGNGNVLLASNTASTDFPTINAFQNTNAGQQDAAFIRAAPDLSSVAVCSYLGGINDDAAFVLAVNPTNGNIYVGGNTLSPHLPGDTTGVFQDSLRGNTDGFVCMLSPSANALLKTSYFGTPDFDMLYGIQFDKFGYPYIMGTTTGSWPVVNALFSQANGKQFIAKLQPNLSGFLYSTVFGTGSTFPNISPIAMLVDRCENVYVSGWGGSVNAQTGYKSAGTIGLTITSNAIQKTTDGSDFYFFVLERNAKAQLYGSFFGQYGGAAGEHVDGGTSRFDRDGVIYQSLCANCSGGATFPTTPGAWSRTNGASNCNLAAVKIAFNLAGLENSIKSSIQGSVQDTIGCVPLRVDFKDTLAEGKKYIWVYGDGSKSDTTNGANTSHVYNAVGVYLVMLISVDSAKCNIADTARTFINVKTYKVSFDFDFQKLPPCDSFNYRFINLSTVTPSSRSFDSTSFIWDFGDGSSKVIAGLDTLLHSFPGAGTYNVKLSLVDTNFCNNLEDTIKTLRIASNVKAGFETLASGCAPYTAIFNNITIAGEQYLWSFGDGDTSSLQTPTHLYNTPGNYMVTLIAKNGGSCNKSDTFLFKITVHDVPIANFSFTPNPPQQNVAVTFTNTSVNADWFLWKFGDGDSLYRQNRDNVEHLYNKTQVFDVCLTAYNKNGCIDTLCLPVAARVLPLLDVPSALTPNNDGINDKIFVRGFGIERMLWRIYNRWGTLIFETSDKNTGWDGTYKGSLQPVEVYHYTLDVGYSDNTTIQRTGDITLIR